MKTVFEKYYIEENTIAFYFLALIYNLYVCANVLDLYPYCIANGGKRTDGT